MEKKNHELRQMQGKRIVGKSTGYYVAAVSGESQIVKTGHWQDIPCGEQMKQAEINKLKVIKFLAMFK